MTTGPRAAVGGPRRSPSGAAARWSPARWGRGRIAVGDELEVGGRPVRVRGLQSLERPREAVSRGGPGRGEPARGQPPTRSPAARCCSPPVLGGPPPPSTSGSAPTPAELPARAMLHVGTAAHEVRLRPLSGDAARLTLPGGTAAAGGRPGDPARPRRPARRGRRAGPRRRPAARWPRRGAGRAARPGAVAGHRPARPGGGGRAAGGAMRPRTRRPRSGCRPGPVGDATSAPADGRGEGPEAVVRHGDWLVYREVLGGSGATRCVPLSRRRPAGEPLDPTLTRRGGPCRRRAARPLAGPRPGWGVRARDGGREGGAAWGEGLARAGGGGAAPDRGAARLRARSRPRNGPSWRRPGWARARSPRRCAPAGWSASPTTCCCCRARPPRPCGSWRDLPQPFTPSEARQALGTTRRVVMPLLEHLDGRGWTRRLDGSHRQVVR